MSTGNGTYYFTKQTTLTGVDVNNSRATKKTTFTKGQKITGVIFTHPPMTADADYYDFTLDGFKYRVGSGIAGAPIQPETMWLNNLKNTGMTDSEKMIDEIAANMKLANITKADLKTLTIAQIATLYNDYKNDQISDFAFHLTTFLPKASNMTQLEYENQKAIISRKINNTNLVFASAGLVGGVGGIVYAVKKGKGFWGGVGCFILGSLIVGVPTRIGMVARYNNLKEQQDKLDAQYKANK